ncbi:hypothetical protein PBY51_011240 [Eleginops maclovinus]|uniref:Secreted protein n=1 Tax=Eleginops maclovinus TaxID=56733 RepID=A0AAN8AKA2_ELEMC|nr:hypothetical protein PBY51_011240 [Eleginops maclovinus]
MYFCLLFLQFPEAPAGVAWCSRAPVVQRGSSDRAAGEELSLPGRRSERRRGEELQKSQKYSFTTGFITCLRFYFQSHGVHMLYFGSGFISFELRMDVFFTDLPKSLYPRMRGTKTGKQPVGSRLLTGCI